MSKFKPGDRARNVSDNASVPIGYEFTIIDVDGDGDLIFNDADGDRRVRPWEKYELITDATAGPVTFKVGDRVTPVNYDVMFLTEGRSYEVLDVTDHSVYVHDDDGDRMSFWFRQVKLFDGREAATFKVGDTVRVVRKVEQAAGWRDFWVVPEMDSFIGKEFLIEGQSRGGFDLKGSYNFPAEALELVTEKATFKVGDYIVVTTGSRRDVTLGRAYKVERADDYLRGFVVISDDVADEHPIPSGQVRHATPAEIAALPTTFDATKLRKGDKVMVEVEVRRDGVDGDGDVNVRGSSYLKPHQIIGYAPGYAPQAAEEPLKVGDVVKSPTGASDRTILAIRGGVAFCAYGEVSHETIALADLKKVV